MSDAISIPNHTGLFTFYDESIPYYKVSGNVGQPGVSIGGKLSDSQGNYTVKVMKGESVTLTPKLEGYTFQPASRTVGPVTTHVPNQDFTATEKRYVVSGVITDAHGAPLYGVAIGGTTTDANGKYSFQVRPGVTVVLEPALGGYTFEPAGRTIPTISGDKPDQNFRLPPARFIVSGTVTRTGVGQAGVKVGGVLTDINGHYEIVVEEGANLTLAPQFFRYDFTPAQLSLTNIGADTPNQDFAMELASVTPTPTPTINPARPNRAWASPPARRSIVRQGQPRKTSAPTEAMKPSTKRVNGAEPPLGLYSPKISAAMKAPSTMPIISGRKYCTIGAF